MDPFAFMLALLSMFDAEYQLWKGGIAYAQHLLGDLDYDEFSEVTSCLIFLSGYVSSLSHLFFLFILHIIYVVILKCGEHFRLRLV